VTLSFAARDMASYDYSDANGNGFKGYELDGGNYAVKIMRDAHTLVDTVNYTVAAAGIRYENDSATGNKVENLFDNVSEEIDAYMSRADFEGTFPAPVTDGDRAVTAAFISSLTYAVNDTAQDPWYSESAPAQSGKELTYKNTAIKLYDLFGVDYGDPLWDEFLNQLTVGQMKELIAKGNFRTVNIDNIAKPLTIDADGPMGFAIFMGDPSVYDTCYYASECVIGATWNADLAEAMGKMIGNEGLSGYEKGDGRPYSGWYAPAMNIHRSQFGGRNFEYYSEDGAVAAKMAAAVVRGAKSKGVYTYAKHFALNDQETNRDTTGLITWANEQSMRELYFKPFEAAVKDGGTTAMMSAFNRIGAVWAGGNHTLLTRLLRDEWGFRGMVITDFNLTAYMNVDQMIRAGGDLNLSPSKNLSETSSATALTAIRAAAKNILYTVANSNAMNGMGKNVVYGYALPVWLMLVYIGDAVAVALLGGWGALVIVRAKKKERKAKAEANFLSNNN
jgi:beta-glucosidase